MSGSSFHSRSTEQKEYPRENRKRSEDSYRRYPGTGSCFDGSRV